MTSPVTVVASDISDRFSMYNGDCVEVIRGLPDNSAGYSIFSPPFEGLYVYSASPRDMGNSKSSAEFAEHMSFLAGELLRVTRPGRLLSMHCMLLPTSKARDGFIGIRDFRGDLIRQYQAAGFIFHSEVVIWKCPVQAMQRSKSLGLLHKQIRKDSCMSRQGIPDYLVTFRKPGENPVPVSHEPDINEGDEPYPVKIWQRVASPIWMSTSGTDDEGFAIPDGSDDKTDHGTIQPGDTLQRESAREERDERHVCPLQLQVIRRAIRLWSKPETKRKKDGKIIPADVILSPFAGIGSEGYVALQEGRRFVGIELKESYYKQAVANLRSVECGKGRQQSMFGD